MSLTEVEVELFFVDSPHSHKKSETELMAWLKQKANVEYEAKGFVILAFEVISIGLEHGGPRDSVASFITKRTPGPREKTTDSIHALVKLSLMPKTESSSDKADE